MSIYHNLNFLKIYLKQDSIFPTFKFLETLISAPELFITINLTNLSNLDNTHLTLRVTLAEVQLGLILTHEDLFNTTK